MQVFLDSEYRVVQRGAWTLSLIIQQYPELILPYLPKLLRMVGSPDVHDAVRRNIMRLLQYVKIPSRYHGKVLEVAFDFLQDRKQPVAVRVFSMTVIEQIAAFKPELLRELKLIIEDEMPYSSAAFQSRGSKVLKKLNKLEKAI